MKRFLSRIHGYLLRIFSPDRALHMPLSLSLKTLLQSDQRFVQIQGFASQAISESNRIISFTLRFLALIVRGGEYLRV